MFVLQVGKIPVALKLKESTPLLYEITGRGKESNRSHLSQYFCLILVRKIGNQSPEEVKYYCFIFHFIFSHTPNADIVKHKPESVNDDRPIEYIAKIASN